MVRCFGVSGFQGQPGDLHFSLWWVIFHETQRSKLVTEKGCVSMRNCAKVCQLSLSIPDSSPANHLQFTKALRPAPDGAHQSQFMFLRSRGKEVSDQHIDLLVQPGKQFIFPKAETYIWCLGYVVDLFALEIQERCTRWSHLAFSCHCRRTSVSHRVCPTQVSDTTGYQKWL